jgi:erythromycin esterase-like protein
MIVKPWRNTVIDELADELRAHNGGIADPEARVGFYGLDIYNMQASITAVLSYLDQEDPEAAKVARERYGCLTPWQSDPAIYGRVALTRGFPECERAVVDQCRELLEQALAPGEESEDEASRLDAAMNARLVASAEKYYRVMYYGGAESWNLRDSHMAETLEHLLEARGPNARALVWAHNSHIGDARATDMGSVRGEHNIGQLIREKLGDEVALVGLGTHTGSVTCATDWDGHTETKRVLPSRRDSYERVCHDAVQDVGSARFLLDLGREPHQALRRRLAEPKLERFIGVIYRPETERWSHYSEAVLPDQFDAYVWFDETRALTPLGPEHARTGAEDTYPFGL